MTSSTDESPIRVYATGCLDLPGGEALPVAADLVYRPRDCLAVNMVLRGADGAEVGWTFAWELLGRGLTAHCGEGDITVGPVPGDDALVEVAFVSLFAATIRFPADDVERFVREVRARVPLDARHIRPALDEELAAILEQA